MKPSSKPCHSTSAATFALAITVGCGPSISEEDNSLSTFARKVCELKQECGCGDPVGADECEAEEEKSLSPSGAGLSFDESCARETLDALEQLGCGSLGKLLQFRQFSCKLFHGSKRAGEACTRLSGDTYDDDCGPELICDGEGVCTPVRAGLGEACQAHACADGLACDLSAEAGVTCQVGAALGASCEQGVCESGLACDQTDTCVEPAALGERCFGLCQSDSWCDNSTAILDWVCRAKKKNGEPCALSNECESEACDLSALVCMEGQPWVCEAYGGA